VSLLGALNRMEPAMRDAFLAAVRDIKSEAQLSVIARHLENGDIPRALAAMHLDAEFFAPLDDALRAAYLEGGRQAMTGLPAIPDPFPAGAWSAAFLRAIRARRGG
jgi:hypothetical protein